MLAVKKLAEIQKGSEKRNMSRKKTQEPTSVECTSPKMNTFQENEPNSEILDGSEKEVRTVRQNSGGSQRGSASSVHPKPRQTYPQGPPYTPPQTPTKTKPPSSPKNGTQVMDKPSSCPTHRAYPEAGRKEEVQKDSTSQSATPVSVPQILLPPEGNESGKQEQEMKKRAHSLNRYDAEQERNEADLANANTTVQRRVSRSNSVRNQSDKNNDKNVKNEKNVNRGSQSFALRQKKKGPPPPPPKRSSSAISSSNTNLNDMPKDTGTGNLLDVNYNPQRRASAVETGVTMETGAGGAIETGSLRSVRSIAAMLEMSSIGGGAKGLAMQRAAAHSLRVGSYLLILFFLSSSF